MGICQSNSSQTVLIAEATDRLSRSKSQITLIKVIDRDPFDYDFDRPKVRPAISRDQPKPESTDKNEVESRQTDDLPKNGCVRKTIEMVDNKETNMSNIEDVDSNKQNNKDKVRHKKGDFSTEDKTVKANEDNITSSSTPEVAVVKQDDTKTTSPDDKQDAVVKSNRVGVLSHAHEIRLESNYKLPIYPKAPDDEQLIKAAIEKNDFLSKVISGKALDSVVAAMYNKEISPRQKIINQGETGSHMYVSAKGKFQIIVDGKVNLEFDDTRVFGELAILYKSKRLATVKALTEGRVWVLDREVYQNVMITYNIKEQTEIMEFLMKNETLNIVGRGALEVVASLLKTEFFSPDKIIFKQGDKGQKFYIIRAGTVTISKDGVVVGSLKKGDCFGELALLKEDCRQATVTANNAGVECLTLTRKEFIDNFGEIGDRFKYISTEKPRSSEGPEPSEYADVRLADLKIITTLGVGGFGRVELVQHKARKNLVFALKYMKKIDIVAQGQQEHCQNEKIIQMKCRSPFIVRLYNTYKDPKYVYFLLEVCLGGDLWSLLQKQRNRRFDEKEAHFICGCVLEAFDYLHSMGIVYRDLKPENLIVAPNGYIKLTDFGFAKKITQRIKTYTFAGTPEYVAPEIVLTKGHDRAVDYWAYGVFVFEMLTGKTPFRTDDPSHMRTYNKILSGIDNITFPSYMNPRAKNLIDRLCRPVASERLGMQRGGIKDIKTHKWFQGFDWNKLSRCEMPSPFVPKLKSSTDTSNIDKFSKDLDIPEDDLTDWDSSF